MLQQPVAVRAAGEQDPVSCCELEFGSEDPTTSDLVAGDGAMAASDIDQVEPGRSRQGRNVSATGAQQQDAARMMASGSRHHRAAPAGRGPAPEGRWPAAE